MIRITFEGVTMADLHAAILNYLSIVATDCDPPLPAPVAQPEQPVPAKRGRKPNAAAPETKPTQDKATPEPAAVATAPVAAAPNVELGPDAVAPDGAVFLAVKAYNDKHGMEKARALLAKFGAGMVRQIKPADYQAVIAACQA